jgi:hypothetical protein
MRVLVCSVHTIYIYIHILYLFSLHLIATRDISPFGIERCAISILLDPYQNSNVIARVLVTGATSIWAFSENLPPDFLTNNIIHVIPSGSEGSDSLAMRSFAAARDDMPERDQ